MESPPWYAALGRGLVLVSTLSACGESALSDNGPAPKPPAGVSRDTPALVRPPEWPARVQWSDAVANQRQMPLDADADGVLDLLLLGRGSAIAYLARGLGDGGFSEPTLIRNDRLALVEGATSLADVNADGLLDLIYLSALSNNDTPRRARATALVSQGDGHFVARVSDFDGYAGPITATDLDGDGRLDLLVACPGSNDEARGQSYLFALLGAGDGTFSPSAQPPVQLPDLSTAQLLIANLHGVNASAPSTQTLVVAGRDRQGQGSFSLHALSNSQIGPAELVQVLGEPAPHAVAAADLDGDGRSELVFYSAQERNVTSVRFETRRGALVSKLEPHAVEGDLYALSEGFSVADLDLDGKPDLLLPGSDTRSTDGFRFGPVLIAAFGDGSGHFDRHRVLQLAARDGEFGAHALAADLDGDGVQDLSLATYGTEGASGRIGVLLGPLRR